MKKQNQMLWILGILGVCSLIASFVLLVTIQNLLVSVLLLASGIFLIIGGFADRKERIRRARGRDITEKQEGNHEHSIKNE